MGLLLPHIFTVALYNDMVSLTCAHDNHNGGGGKRGQVYGMSKEARYRLFRCFHGLSFQKFSFITLTYAESFPENIRISKKHLQEFRRLFERKWGKIRAVWRLEIQERGAPHYHIMYLDCPYIPVQEIETVWHTARGEYGLEKTRNSVDLKISRRKGDADVVSKYLGKYIAKPDKDISDTEKIKTGRTWGKWNIVDPKPEKINLYEVEAREFANRILPPESAEGWHPISRFSFTCFGVTMGTGQYRDIVKTVLMDILRRREAIEHKKVIFST